MVFRCLFLLQILFFFAYLPGCARSQRLLSNAGQLVLVKDGERVVLKGKDRLFIRWKTDGQELATQAAMDGRDSLVAVMVLEADERTLRVRADAWKRLEDVPHVYSAAGIRVTGGKGRRGRPVVNVPLSDIEEIALCERRLTTADWAGFSRRNATIGALGGFAFGAMVAGADEVVFREKSRRDDYDFLPLLRGNEALVATAVTTVTGAVMYPVYRVFWPRFHQHDERVFAIGEERWRVEIER
jgi:hypothetical protein